MGNKLSSKARNKKKQQKNAMTSPIAAPTTTTATQSTTAASSPSVKPTSPGKTVSTEDVRPEIRKENHLQDSKLVQETNFTASEIDIIRDRLQASFPSNSGINRQQFHDMLGVPAESLYASRLFDVFDSNSTQMLDIDDVIRCLSVLSTKGSITEKLDLSFRILDLEGTQSISKANTLKMLQSVLIDAKAFDVDLHLAQEQIEIIVENTFASAETNAEGHIERQEYHDLGTRYSQLLFGFLTVQIGGVMQLLEKSSSSSRSNMKL